MTSVDPERNWCPSGDAYAPEAVVLGVRSGPAGEISYLAEPVPAAEVLPDVPEGIEPRRILRFASHCESSCANRVGEQCSLISRVLTVPAQRAEGALPRCHLRTHCTWWRQTGVAACHRCPAVITENLVDDELAQLVADPSTSIEQLEAWIAADAVRQE